MCDHGTEVIIWNELYLGLTCWNRRKMELEDEPCAYLEGIEIMCSRLT
jgi:hypothetical protein